MITAANNPGQDGGRAVEQAHSNSSSTSEAQCSRLLAWLRSHGWITTIDARKHLDVLHPAMRVLALRKRGHDIRAVWSRQETACGKVHCVARYMYFPQVTV